MTSQAQVKLTPVTPRVPNFIRIEEMAASEGKLPVSAFSEAALRRIGEQWTEALIARAKEQREVDGA